MSTKILDLIAQLEVEIADSPRPKVGGAHKRVVDFDRIMDLIGDMRVTIPEEVRLAQSILTERDTLLSKASAEAKAIYDNACAEHERLVAQEDVLIDAQTRAQEALLNSKETGRTIVLGACNYADDILTDLQRYIRDYSRIIDANREELHNRYAPKQPVQAMPAQAMPGSMAGQPQDMSGQAMPGSMAGSMTGQQE